MPSVLRQDWEEPERGWGVVPDGYSMHLDVIHRDKFVDAYWAKMPHATPDIYSRPVMFGLYEVEIDQATYRKIVAAGGSLRVI